VTRNEALAAAVGIIGKHVPDLAALVSLLELAGQLRLAAALRGRAVARPVEVGGKARPNVEIWSRGRL
jgi:hypothetical protein